MSCRPASPFTSGVKPLCTPVSSFKHTGMELLIPQNPPEQLEGETVQSAKDSVYHNTHSSKHLTNHHLCDRQPYKASMRKAEPAMVKAAMKGSGPR